MNILRQIAVIRIYVSEIKMTEVGISVKLHQTQGAEKMRLIQEFQVIKLKCVLLPDKVQDIIRQCLGAVDTSSRSRLGHTCAQHRQPRGA